MRDAGVPWLGSIPEVWNVVRLKQALREVDQRSSDGSEDLLTVSQYTGVTRRRESVPDGDNMLSRALSLIGYKLVSPGDIVVNIMLAWNGSLGASPVAGITSPAYCVYRTTSGDNPRFLHYLFRTSLYKGLFKMVSTGVVDSRLRLYPDMLLRLQVPFPPVPQQDAIVRYLDFADHQIQRYVQGNRKLIALLNEQKQTIIHRAVTCGLEPNVPLKASGVEWLGNVPYHWKVRRLKQISRIQRGKFSHRPRNDPSLYDGPYPFIQTGSVTGATKFITEFSQTLNDKGLQVSKLFRRGTLVMTIAANIGDVAILNFDSCFPDSVVGFAPGKHIERDYLYYVLRGMKLELLQEAPVNTQGNLNAERLGALGVPLPPRDEQRDIASDIERRTAALDEAIIKLSRRADLIREFREKLVTDIVTGKFDVREAARAIPTDSAHFASDDGFMDIADVETTELEDEDLETIGAGT
jgi:type I restriction enzyme S subunit